MQEKYRGEKALTISQATNELEQFCVWEHRGIDSVPGCVHFGYRKFHDSHYPTHVWDDGYIHSDPSDIMQAPPVFMGRLYKLS